MDISKQVVLIWALPILTLLAILAIIIRSVSIKKHGPSSKDTTSNLQLSDPYCSSTSSSSPLTWDVFLSFHGKDTRINFTSHLYSALDQAGIRTFKDDHALEKGQEISSSLLDAIRNSNMFIVVLSENYARSRWCLDELAEILSCDTTKNQVVPVFCYVDPSDVRHQKGSFGKALDGHKKRHSADMIVKWKSALSEIAKLTGYHMVKPLGQIESLKLFSYHAFRKPVPPESFKELSLSFVTHAGGLPLALKVLGSSLLGRTHESFWKDKLEKVKAIPENDIQKILQLSYDELDDETEKAIFLDIAFFFVGTDKNEATHVFKSCDFFPGVGIQNLVDRCLLTIDKYNNFRMHNLIQDMGRELGRATRTRLFLRGDAWKDLQNPEERNNVEGLILDLTTSPDKQLSTVIFERMWKLRLLQIIDANDIAGSFENLLPKLKCIRWHYCAWMYLPSTFGPQNLISIDMPFSKFKKLWKAPMPIKQLSYLSCLQIWGCPDLKQLPEQLGDLKALKKIDASYTEIEKLPDSITHLKQLAELNLFRWENLRRIPEHIGNLECLRTFELGNTSMEQLPDSFGGLVNLERLDLTNCENLRNLPDSIWKLKSLKTLDLEMCSKLERLPEQLGKMQCLERLNAYGTAIEQVPDSIGLLSRLRALYLSSKKLKCVPESIWNLTSIERLDLDVSIISLPDSVRNMDKIKVLELSCNVRLWLPMIQCLSSLEELSLTDDSDEGQILSWPKPFSLSKLFNLQSLKLDNCTSLGSSLPELPLNLQVLRVYNHNSLEQVPDLSMLKELEQLHIQGCISLRSISLLPSRLASLFVEECASLQDLPDLSMLKELEELRFTRCNNLKSISLKQSSLQVGCCWSHNDKPAFYMLKYASLSTTLLHVTPCSFMFYYFSPC